LTNPTPFADREPGRLLRLEEWLVARQFGLLRRLLARLPEVSRARMQSALTQALLMQTQTIETPAGAISFVLMGRTSAGRARTLLTKQPATIAWIDRLLLTRPLVWEAGYVLAPDGPGLGVEIDEAVARAHPWTGDRLHLEMSPAPQEPGSGPFGGG
jgi:hypothetical protein